MCSSNNFCRNFNSRSQFLMNNVSAEFSWESLSEVKFSVVEYPNRWSIKDNRGSHRLAFLPTLLLTALAVNVGCKGNYTNRTLLYT